MPDLKPKPGLFRHGQKQLDYRDLNEMRSMDLRQVSAGPTGGTIAKFQDRVIFGVDIEKQVPERGHRLAIVLAEDFDTLICAPFVQPYNEEPEWVQKSSGYLFDQQFRVAKPYILQKTPWEGKSPYGGPIVFDPVQYDVRTNNGVVERIFPAYVPGELILCLDGTTGYTWTTTELLNDPETGEPKEEEEEVEIPVLWTDANSAGRTWKPADAAGAPVDAALYTVQILSSTPNSLGRYPGRLYRYQRVTGEGWIPLYSYSSSPYGTIDRDAWVLENTAFPLMAGNRYQVSAAETKSIFVSGATNSSPIIITTQQPHNLVTGERVNISGVLGNLAANDANGIPITIVSATSFSIPKTGTGNYTGGGKVIPVQKLFISDFEGVNVLWKSGPTPTPFGTWQTRTKPSLVLDSDQNSVPRFQIWEAPAFPPHMSPPAGSGPPGTGNAAYIEIVTGGRTGSYKDVTEVVCADGVLHVERDDVTIKNGIEMTRTPEVVTP